MKLTVVLPAYNEEKALPKLLDALNDVFETVPQECNVLVVDDGSADGTADVVRAREHSMPVKLISHIQNKGLGAAMRTGLSAAAEQSPAADAVITMDADNTHDPRLIPAMVEKIQGGADIVIASRYCPGGEEVGLAWHRKILSRGASTFLKMCFPLPGARDCSCGYRAYSKGIVDRGFKVYGDKLIEQAGFACMAELLVKLSMAGARIDEVPLVLRYDLKAGVSKMNIRRTVGQYVELARQKRRLASIAAGGRQ